MDITSDKFQEVVDHVGYIFNEKPEVVRQALKVLGSFDELFILCLSANEAGLGLEEAIKELEEPGSSFLSKKKEVSGKMPYYVQ